MWFCYFPSKEPSCGSLKKKSSTDFSPSHSLAKCSAKIKSFTTSYCLGTESAMWNMLMSNLEVFIGPPQCIYLHINVIWFYTSWIFVETNLHNSHWNKMQLSTAKFFWTQIKVNLDIYGYANKELWGNMWGH